ncbi:unnamed protein product [Durusdinium trenchii]|uniref:Uncharacterized protein n=1 Tax=Durusdinium trenchii TaxID=1381693 RepID=A0ABP0PR17_9DINO
MQDLAAAQQQGAADARHSDGASSSLKGDGSCTSTCTTRADAEYTIDIEKEVDKLIEDPSRPRRFKCTRGKEKKKDSNQLGFLPCRPEGDSVSSGLAAYRARGLATLQAIEMHDKPSSLWRGLDRRDRQGDAGLSAYRAHGLATLQAMEAGYEEGPWAPVYSGVGWYSGQPEADWMAAGGTAVLVPAGQVSIAQAPQARKESVWKERAQEFTVAPTAMHTTQWIYCTGKPPVLSASAGHPLNLVRQLHSSWGIEFRLVVGHQEVAMGENSRRHAAPMVGSVTVSLLICASP